MASPHAVLRNSTMPQALMWLGEAGTRSHGQLQPRVSARLLCGHMSEQPRMPHFGMPRRVVETTARSRTQVNWKRGFFRTWLLLSGAWIMSWVLWLMIYGISKGFRDIHEVFTVPVLLLGPPVALLVFGLLAGWAVRGFKADEEEEKEQKK
jgi:hypothetical protein